MNAALPANACINPRVHARVDATAVAHNLAVLTQPLQRATPAPRVWATVKADAYGHGLARVLPGLGAADGLAVMQLPEAHACRQLGWHGPILVYGGLLDDTEIPLLDAPGLHLVITHMGQLEALDTHAGTYPAPWVWLRFAGDIGMTGFSAIEYVAAYARAKAMVHQGRIAGIGHLNQHGRADCVDGIAEADACFRALVETLPGPRTTSNSATVLVHGAHAAATDWIRPGLALYGASPLPGRDGAALGLRPAMSLHSRIVGVRTLAAGEPLGYGGAYTARAPMRIGMIGTGYADGYPRQAPAGTPTLIDGYPAPLLGVVTMDLMAVDITHLPQAGVGAPVALWGVPGLPVEAVASAVGTIAADLLTGLTARVPFFN